MKHRLLLLSAMAMLVMTACEKPKMEVYPRCFSVSETTQVFFSPGNLQYDGTTKKYSFAPTQMTVIGGANRNISDTYGGAIDLFGWGTGNNPMMSSTVGTDYATFVDWGSKMDEPGWRTLSFEEWNYLIQKRPNANKLYGSCAIVNIMGGKDFGMVILPDTWDCDTIDVSYSDNFLKHQYDSELWKKMEKAGAVFLPTAGDRMGNSIATSSVGNEGRYWSSTPITDGCAHYIGFGDFVSEESDGTLRSHGRSVRLVKEITSPSQIPAAK